MRAFLLAVAVVVAMAGPAMPPAVADAADIEARLQDLLASFRDDYGFPGVTAAYVLPDGTTGVAAVGHADIEAEEGMTPETRMLAASIGKTFVGALVLSLESDGVLARDDRISVYLESLPWFSRLPNASTITVGHLLTHTSGLRDHVHMDGVLRALIEGENGRKFEPETAIAFILDTPPLFEPGAAWSYSDTGYLVLGLVIEAATGRDFYELVSRRFLRPLGLSRTSPSTSPDLVGLAVGYTIDDNAFGLPARTMDGHGRLLWNPVIEWTGGGFVSTSGDLVRWGHALFSGEVFEAPCLERLLDGVPVSADAPGVLYGSGVAIYSSAPFGPVYGHGGWVPGYVSSLRHYANHGVTIAFQINTDAGVVDDSTDLVAALEAALASLLIDAGEDQ